MKVLVDTCIWSKALRRCTVYDDSLVTLTELIDDDRVAIIGAIRQEVLSGIKHDNQFERVQQGLKPFKDLALNQKDYVLAARLFNELRSKGIQGSNTDFLICAVAINHKLSILTDDRDFTHFSEHIPITLYPFGCR